MDDASPLPAAREREVSPPGGAVANEPTATWSAWSTPCRTVSARLARTPEPGSPVEVSWRRRRADLRVSRILDKWPGLSTLITDVHRPELSLAGLATGAASSLDPLDRSCKVERVHSATRCWNAGEPTRPPAAWMTTADPQVAEYLAGCGFDEVCVDQQRGLGDMGSICGGAPIDPASPLGAITRRHLDQDLRMRSVDSDLPDQPPFRAVAV